MASIKKACPSCGAQNAATAEQCTKCSVLLRLTSWEFEDASGTKVAFEGEGAVEALRGELIAGTRTLADRCRQRVRPLERVTGDEKEYGPGEETEWKALRDHASRVFALHVLFDPVAAYAKRTAQQTWVAVGIATAIAWNMSLLIEKGANPIVALVLSAILLVLTPTVIGIIIGSLVVGALYDLPGTAMGFRSLFALLIGIAVGGAVGWTFGYTIGAIIGASKQKLVRDG